MAGYSSRVRKDISRWLDAGLIDPIVAEALRRDVDADRAAIPELRIDPGDHGCPAAWRRHPDLRRVELGSDTADRPGWRAVCDHCRWLRRRRRLEGEGSHRDRRGAMAGCGGGIRRLDRADRPDVPPVRRRNRSDPHLVSRDGPRGRRPALGTADHGSGGACRCLAGLPRRRTSGGRATSRTPSLPSPLACGCCRSGREAQPPVTCCCCRLCLLRRDAGHRPQCHA